MNKLIKSGEKVLKKIKKSNLVKLFNFKKEVKSLNDKITTLEEEKIK